MAPPHPEHDLARGGWKGDVPWTWSPVNDPAASPVSGVFQASRARLKGGPRGSHGPHPGKALCPGLAHCLSECRESWPRRSYSQDDGGRDRYYSHKSRWLSVQAYNQMARNLSSPSARWRKHYSNYCENVVAKAHRHRTQSLAQRTVRPPKRHSRIPRDTERCPWLTLSHSLSAGAILLPGIPSLEPPPLRKLQGAHCCELSRVTLTPGAGSGAGLGGRPGVASSSAGDTVRVAPASLLAWFTSTYVTNTQHAFIIFAVTIFW